MIAYCVQHFRFRRLLKIDDTCVMTQMQMGAREYGGKESLDAPALIAYLKGSSPDIEYTGFFFHAHAGREGAESWAHKKGITIDYERLFGNGPLPPFYDGKCYLLGRDFAEFVAEHGADVATEQKQYFHGSEDVMIGRLYQQFQAGRA